MYSLDVDLNAGEHSSAAGAPRYTPIFGGTSAAAAIVAGAAIALQGIVQASLSQPGSRFRLSAFQMRNLLSDETSINSMPINTHSNNPAQDLIGVMPNLGRIVENLVSIVPDIVVRDDLADNGDPHIRLVETSPDIIVRPSGTITNPQGAFGGSATIRNPNLSLPVDTGTGSYDIFVRVFNRGRASAAGAEATVYWTHPATNLNRPDLWNKIGTSASSNVPTSLTSLTVLSGITWPRSQIPAPDLTQNQYSFIATIGCPADPDPIPDHTALTSSLTSNQFLNLLRWSNNISRRNFHVVVLPSATGANLPRAMSLPNSLLPANLAINFLAPGAYDVAREMQLEVVAHLPHGAQLWLEGPADFLSAMVKGHFEPAREEKMRLELSPYGVNRFREITFAAKSLNPLRLQVSVPEEHRRGTYEVYVRHLDQGEEVGRITWQLVPEIEKGESSLKDYMRWFFAGISPLSCLFYFLVIMGLLIIIYLLWSRQG